MSAISEVDIWAKVIGPSWQELPREIAHAVLKLKFDKKDLTRIKALSARVQDGELSKQELTELDHYVHVGRVIALMHSQARRSLQNLAGDLKPAKRKAS